MSALGSDASAHQIPEAVEAQDYLAADSARYLGDYGDKSYYVARGADNPKNEVCLVEFEPDSEEVASGCSDPTPGWADLIVILKRGESPSGIALVRDNPSETDLEEAGWSKIADNLWHKQE
ncbi:hypothetical protein A6F49_03950 [Enteractinococcus helveticum]|uniref:Uncharacterized protein n=1 Tax=Enteractinococcus helveticum TaxID=1837282 RepID=A0A1B7M308_9MICC|nr:hypothetical protein A6F49_03950 [Enteractinococcus helveticum]